MILEHRVMFYRCDLQIQLEAFLSDILIQSVYMNAMGCIRTTYLYLHACFVKWKIALPELTFPLNRTLANRVCIRDANLVITALAYVLTPKGTRLFAGTVLTINLDMLFAIYGDFWLPVSQQMTQFKMADVISWNLAALRM